MPGCLGPSSALPLTPGGIQAGARAPRPRGRPAVAAGVGQSSRHRRVLSPERPSAGQRRQIAQVKTEKAPRTPGARPERGVCHRPSFLFVASSRADFLTLRGKEAMGHGERVWALGAQPDLAGGAAPRGGADTAHPGVQGPTAGRLPGVARTPAAPPDVLRERGGGAPGPSRGLLRLEPPGTGCPSWPSHTPNISWRSVGV